MLLGVDRTVGEVDRLAEHVHHATERGRADGHRDRRARIDRLHAAAHAVGRLHRDGADAVLTEMLLDLHDDVDLVTAVACFGPDPHGTVDGRQVPALEFQIDDRADDLDDLADLLGCCSCCHMFVDPCAEKCLKRFRARHDLDDLSGDRGLTDLVHVERQMLQHVRRIARRGVHRGHLRGIERRVRFEQRAQGLHFDVSRDSVLNSSAGIGSYR